MNTAKRLLIVDDEPDFARFVAKVADDLGYNAVMTTTAHAFRSEYLAVLPDVIVLDIVMPEQDGIETIKWLVDRGCRARILIISGYCPTFAFAAKLIGEVQGNIEVSQLEKPIRVAELRARLQAAAA